MSLAQCFCLGGKIVTQDETGKLVAKPLPKNDEDEKEEAKMSMVTYSKLYQDQNKAQKEQEAKQQKQQTDLAMQNTAIPVQNSDAFGSFQPTG